MKRGLILTVLTGFISLSCWADGYQFELSAGPFWLNTSDFALGNEVVDYGAGLSNGAIVDLDGIGYSIDAIFVIPARLGPHNGLRLAYEYWNVDGTTERFQRDSTPIGTFLGILPIDPSSTRPISYFNSISNGEFSHDTDSHVLSLYLMRSAENRFFEELTWGYGLVAGYYRSSLDFYLTGLDAGIQVMEDDDFEVETTRVGIGIIANGSKQLPKGFLLVVGVEARLCLGWQQINATQRQAGGYDDYDDVTNTAHDENDAVFMPELIFTTGIERPVGRGFILFVRGDARYMGNMPEPQMPYGDYSEVAGFGLNRTSFYGYRATVSVRREF